MGERVATLIIEPRSLVCEGLVSLMASHSYHVVGGVASTAYIGNSLLVADVPKLVILGALPAEEATPAASCIRKLWPETKIILLFEHALLTDFQKLLVSEIDGCIPLSASPDTLIGTLQQIIAADFKMLVLRTAKCSPIPCTTGRRQEGDGLELDTNTLSGAIAHEAASRSVIALPSARLPIAPVVTNEEARDGAFDGSLSIRVRHGLSEREEQVLRDLVKGLPNKMIARKRDMAEATVKVHMKSILRKIRLTNRTQAAIWALENGYGADDLHPELPRLEATFQLLEASRQAR